jgi:hypothetical protein
MEIAEQTQCGPTKSTSVLLAITGDIMYTNY